MFSHETKTKRPPPLRPPAPRPLHNPPHLGDLEGDPPPTPPLPLRPAPAAAAVGGEGSSLLGELRRGRVKWPCARGVTKPDDAGVRTQDEADEHGLVAVDVVLRSPTLLLLWSLSTRLLPPLRPRVRLRFLPQLALLPPLPRRPPLSPEGGWSFSRLCFVCEGFVVIMHGGMAVGVGRYVLVVCDIREASKS